MHVARHTKLLYPPGTWLAILEALMGRHLPGELLLHPCLPVLGITHGARSQTLCNGTVTVLRSPYAPNTHNANRNNPKGEPTHFGLVTNQRVHAAI
jgi:hypothetical protein